MGDLLGSPRVAPLLLFYDGISMIYVRTCRANSHDQTPIHAPKQGHTVRSDEHPRYSHDNTSFKTNFSLDFLL
ncbi:hypothetical protein AAG906_036971 [Vitis piasezkii]